MILHTTGHHDNISAGFISGLAHAVGNSLANINLSTELLETVVNDKELTLYTGIIRRNATRINDLITELIHHRSIHYQRETKIEQRESGSNLRNGAGIALYHVVL